MKTNKPKARAYVLASGKKPLTYDIKTKHTVKRPLLYWDEKANNGGGANRELRYAPNQKSIFVDEQDDNPVMSPITFEDGALAATDRDILLQDFMDRHPDNVKNGGSVFKELDHEARAREMQEQMDKSWEAERIAREDLELPVIAAILRESGARNVEKKDSETLKYDIRVLARNNPDFILDAVTDSAADISQGDVLARALQAGLVQYRKNQSELFWNTNKKSRILRIPADETPEDAIRYFFKSNEGAEVYQILSEKLNELEN